MERETEEVRRAAFRQLVDSLRRATAGCASLAAPVDALHALAEQATRLADSIKSLSGDGPFVQYAWDLDRFPDVFDIPFNPVSGPFNPLAPLVTLERDSEAKERVVARVTYSKAYEGAPSWVHGGYVAAMFDQVLAFANRARHVWGVTRSLSVNYRRPTPLETELRFVGHCERIEERKLFSRGQCFVGDELVSDCEGVFARFDAASARQLFKRGGDPETRE